VVLVGRHLLGRTAAGRTPGGLDPLERVVAKRHRRRQSQERPARRHRSRLIIDWCFQGIREEGMSDFLRALAVADLPPGQAAEVAVGGQTVAIFNLDGTFHALGNTCAHRGGPLGQGFVEGTTVSCPWHNWTYEITTGENVASSDVKVPRYEVKVEDDQVWVRLT
jgi:nitrite reductase/ring-hydroxylating ferredoxin subunit